MTKFYIHNTTPVYTPATIRGSWDDTAGAVVKSLNTRKDYDGGTITSVARAEAVATADYDILLLRGISGPLAAQTIDGTVNLVLGLRESNIALNAHIHLHIYVTEGDTDVVRGTLLSNYTEAAGTNELPTSLTAFGFALNSTQTLSSVVIQEGDRLVIEIGVVARNTSTSSLTATLYYGVADSDTGLILTNDLAVSGNGTALAGFIDFSDTIVESTSIAVRDSQSVVEVAYTPANPIIRASQTVVEVAYTPNPNLILSHQNIEVLCTTSPNIRITGQVVEVLRSTAVDPLFAFASNSLELDSVATYSLNDEPESTLKTKVGTFTKTGGVQFIQTNFRPKLVILWTSGNIAEGWETGHSWMIGCTSGPAVNYSIGNNSPDAWTTTVPRTRAARPTATVHLQENGTQVIIAESVLLEFSETGFRLNWTLDNSAPNYLINYIALGGDDLEVNITNWARQTTTGNQSVTGVGFQPDLVLHLSIYVNSDTDTTHYFGIGCMNNLGQQWTYAGYGAYWGSNNKRLQRTNKCLTNITASVIGEAEYVSMDADGFTVNWTTAPTSAISTISISLKNINHKIGAFNKSGLGTQSITGLGFRPDLILLSSFNREANTSIIADVRHSFGAANNHYPANNIGSAYTLVQDADSNPSLVDARLKTNKIIGLSNVADGVLESEANLDSVSDDGFTLDWTQDDSAVAIQLTYIAIGEIPAGDDGIIEESATSTLTLDQSVVVILVITVSVSDTLTLDQAVEEETLNDIDQTLIIDHTFSIELTLSFDLAASLMIDHIANYSIFVPDAVIYECVASSNLTLNHALSRNLVANHALSHTIIFSDPYLMTVPVNDQVLFIPAASGTVVPQQCLVILQVANINITLPCPLFGDSQSNNSLVIVKRTMTGDTFTYVKSSIVQRLRYTFQIDRAKSLELRNFLLNYQSSIIHLTNWKPELWLGLITNNPIDLITTGLRELTGEFLEVTIEFEGVKLF